MIDHRDAVELGITISVQKDAIIKFPNRDEIGHFLATNYGMYSKEAIRPFPELLSQFCKNRKCPYSIDFTNYNEWYEELNIEGIIFEGELKGWEALQDLEIGFPCCEFRCNIDFAGVDFNQRVYFRNTKFVEYLHANCTNFQDVCFNNAIFEKEADFTDSSFNGDTDFGYAQFKGELNFEDVGFYGRVNFYKTFLSNFTRFYDCYFEKGVELSSIKLTLNSYLDFWDISVSGYLNLKHAIINGVININCERNSDNSSEDITSIPIIDLKGTTILGILSRTSFNPIPANWETAVILKHEEIKRNNVIEALRYKAIEKDLYAKELRAKKKSLQEWGEYLALQMSWLSNNHGQDWLRAFFMTIFVFGLLPFTLFYLPVPYFNLEWFVMAWQTFWSTEFLSHFIEYFNPTRYDLLTEAYLSSDTNTTHGLIKLFGAIIFSVGKIFIVYGGVEVVQAFRKYNKNPN